MAGLVLSVLFTVVSASPASAAVSANPIAAPSFNGSVYAVATSGNVVYVGGNFTAAVVGGKLIPRQRLAAVDASTGTLLGWSPSADRTVRAIAINGSQVWIGGDFQTVNGESRDSIARLDGTSGALDPMRHKVTGGAPRALAVGHGRIYMAGLFTGIDGASRGNVAAFDAVTGTLSGWAPRADYLVEAVAVTGNRVYLGGAFDRVNDVSGTRRLAAIKIDGTVDLGFRPQPSAVVHGLAATSDRVYAALGGQGGRGVSYTTTGRANWTITADGDVQTVTVLNSSVYFGGHFDHVCRSARTGGQGTCLDGTIRRVKLFATSDVGTLLQWSPAGNGIRGVLALASSASTGVVAGGEFTAINGITQKRFAIFN